MTGKVAALTIRDVYARHQRRMRERWLRQRERKRAARGRDGHPCGEHHVSARLTDAEVRACRERYIPRDPDHGCAALAREHGVTVSAMHQIITYQTRYSA